LRNIASASLVNLLVWGGMQTPLPPSDKPQSPLVLLVGCAERTSEPAVWTLSHAGGRTETPAPGITPQEREVAARRQLGESTYRLIGVADFVDVETSRQIGERSRLFTPARVNATGMLAAGHKVAVKGLYIEASPARVNLTSVADLASTCP
jgi:hypothetical protein